MSCMCEGFQSKLDDDTTLVHGMTLNELGPLRASTHLNH